MSRRPPIKPFEGRLRSVLSLFFLLAAGCASLPASRGGTVELVILHTNDCHGGHRPVRAPGSAPDAPPRLGGAAALMTFVDGWRRTAGDSAVLLLDAGDIYQGTPEGTETKGKLSIALMNLLGYDAGAIGNHEFDHGVDNLRGLLADARFPLMAENVVDARAGGRPREIPAPVILVRQGVRIGIAGLVTEDLAKVALVDPVNGWVAERELPPAIAAVRQLRDSGAQVIILVTHVGTEHDSRLAAGLAAALPARAGGRPPVDLIVGGHSHTRLDTPLWVAGIPIVQTGANGRAVGEVRVRWDRGASRVTGLEYRVVDLKLENYPEDSRVTTFLAPWLADIDERMNVVVGTAAVLIDRGGRGGGSSRLGNLQTDIVREAMGTQVCFQNKGGIRANLAAGPVRLRDLYTVSPFGNTVVTLELSGRDLRTILEGSLSGAITGIEFSGLRAWYDPDRAVGDRVTRIEVGGQPLEGDRFYTVATNSFLGYGGDGYTQFKDARNWRDTGRIWLELEVEWWKRQAGPITGTAEARWIRDETR